MTVQHTLNRAPLIKHQQGAVLILSLIILLVMTLIGLASMNTSLMQEKMANNAQKTNVTFQAAESAVSVIIEEVLGGDESKLSEALNSTTFQSSSTSLNLGTSHVSASYQVTFLGDVLTTSEGYSNNADITSTTIPQTRYELLGIGSVPGSSAQTIIRQGIEYR